MFCGGNIMRYISDDDRNIATRFLFLSMAITNLQLDRKQFETGNFKIIEVYIELIDRMLKIAMDERKSLRQQMYNKKIKITKQHTGKDQFTHYLITCYGKEEKIKYFHPVMRENVKEIMTELMSKARQ